MPVWIVDDDEAVREGLANLMLSAKLNTRCYESAEAFLAAYDPAPPECLILDMRMPGISGLKLQTELDNRGINVPIIFLTAFGDIPSTVTAIKAGAMDFLTKPVDSAQLLACVEAALQKSRHETAALIAARALRKRLQQLTEREDEVLELALVGKKNREIAEHLNISLRTVETHRTNILLKTGFSRFFELANAIRPKNVVDRQNRSHAKSRERFQRK